VLVTVTLPFLLKLKASMALAQKNSACLSWKLLRNIPDAEPQSVSRGLVSTKREIWNAGAQKKE
jgi:hypothetical protein